MHTRFSRFAAAAALTLLVLPARAQQNTDSDDAKDRLRIVPSAYLQFDGRRFPDWDAVTGTGRLNRREYEMRRLRAGLEGTWKQASFEITVDPFDDEGTPVKDAFLALRLDHELRVRAGQFKLPGSSEYNTSARRLNFLERSVLASQMAAGRDIGVMLDGRRAAVSWELGVFMGDGNGRQDRADTTGAARLAWEPLANLELAGFATLGNTSAVENEAANGLDGRSSSGFRFFDRVYVQGRRLRTGAEAEYTRGSWRLSAAALRVSDERRGQGVDHDDLPSVVGEAWTLTSTWRLGGGAGTAPGKRPWRVALRLEHALFDDSGPRTGRESVRPRASDLRPRGVDALTLGVSYEITDWMRIIGDAGIERYEDRRTAPTAGDRGNYVIGGLRLQLGF